MTRGPRTTTPRLTAVAISTALLATTAACGTDTARPPGAVALAASATGSMATSVQLPTGQVDVGVRDAGRRLDVDLAPGYRGRDAPEGRRWVIVSWRYRDSEGIPRWAQPLTIPGSQGEPVRLSGELVIGGEDLSVGAPSSSLTGPTDRPKADAIAVAVPEDARLTEARLDLRFDGETQQVDLGSSDGAVTGERTASLTALASLPDEQMGATCSSDWTEDGAPSSIAPLCSYATDELPWVAGLGWSARPDRPWLVLNANTAIDAVRRGGSTYAVQRQVEATSVDGAAPRRTLPTTGAGDTRQVDTVAVFATAASDPVVVLGRDLTLRRERGRGPENLTLRLRRTLPAPTTAP